VTDRLRRIHDLSLRVNGSGEAHRKKLLSMMTDHVSEIRELLQNGDPHAYVEAGDLMILAMEMIVEGGRDPQEVYELCCGRFERKLEEMLANRKSPSSDG
jgi:hypothetical protein